MEDDAYRYITTSPAYMIEGPTGEAGRAIREFAQALSALAGVVREETHKMYDEPTREIRPLPVEEVGLSKRDNTAATIGGLAVAVMLLVALAIVLGFVAGLWWLLFEIGWDAIQ